MRALYKSKPRLELNGLEKKEWIKKLTHDLENIPGFLDAYFFGSFARGDNDRWSDVDLIVILKSDDNEPANYDPTKYWDRINLVSNHLDPYLDIEFLVYSDIQWDTICKSKEKIGFWKDVMKDLVTVSRYASLLDTSK